MAIQGIPRYIWVMRSVLGCCLILLLAVPAEAGQKRCGWLHVFLRHAKLLDLDGNWRVVQPPGQIVPSGKWVTIPDLGSYTCACVVAEVDYEKNSASIESSTAKPFEVCRADRRLKVKEPTGWRRVIAK